ncbi:MAG: class I SAM-dependent methyltransferase [Fimbriimonas sp.]|nr:class I SAM-dependent methyltransferase [Fimbriimonas sp.]
MRCTLTSGSWNAFAGEECLAHPIRALLHQDPFTHHAFSKPSGYSGDARLIDYMYGCADPPAETTDVGRSIFTHTTQGPAGRSVVARRDILSKLVDAIAARIEKPRILSVACGHLREAESCRSVRDGMLGEWIGIDQDPHSVALVNGNHRHNCVRAEVGSVRALLTGKHDLGKFDLIYAAGLYDYLEDRTATRLTTRLFEMLRPGGSVLIANFLPTLRDIGYMESFMAWHLIYRDERQIRNLIGGIDSAAVARTETFFDEPGNIVFLQVDKP